MNSKRPTIDRSNRPDLKRDRPKLSAVKPDLETALALDLTPEPDPLADVSTDQPLEDQIQEESSALLEGFRKRAREENERFRLATDSEFWFAVCFQSREQKEAFLTALGWLEQGDKYLDGTQLARSQGIDLPRVNLVNRKRRHDKTFAGLARKRG